MTRLLVVLAACVLGASMLALREPLPYTTSLPAVQLVGHESRIVEPRFVRIDDAEGWRALWAEHTGVQTQHGALSRHRVPHIDFERFMVVGVFVGATTNSDGAVADAIIASRASVRVQYQHATFQTAGGEEGGAVPTQPYGLFVIERSPAPIHFEQGQMTSKASPVSYRRVHTIER